MHFHYFSAFHIKNILLNELWNIKFDKIRVRSSFAYWYCFDRTDKNINNMEEKEFEESREELACLLTFLFNNKFLSKDFEEIG